MSIQDEIDTALAAANMSNKSNTEMRRIVEMVDGQVADVADPTCTYADQSLEGGAAITPVSPSLGGGPVFKFTLGDVLPDGLELDEKTGVVSGTAPAVDLAEVEYDIEVMGSDDDVDTSIKIATSLPITGLAYEDSPLTLADGVAMTAVLPSMDAERWAAYVATDALPAGLSLDAGTGEISGTPSGGASGPTSYTITATNGVDSYEAEVVIEVTA